MEDEIELLKELLRGLVGLEIGLLMLFRLEKGLERGSEWTRLGSERSKLGLGLGLGLEIRIRVNSNPNNQILI
jgi:hypothetical protein